MSENRLLDYLDPMWQAATDACAFVEGLEKDDFLEDKRTQQAVIMRPGAQLRGAFFSGMTLGVC